MKFCFLAIFLVFFGCDRKNVVVMNAELPSVTSATQTTTATSTNVEIQTFTHSSTETQTSTSTATTATTSTSTSTSTNSSPACATGTTPLFDFVHQPNANNDGISFLWHSFYESLTPPIQADANSVPNGTPFACLPSAGTTGTADLYELYNASATSIDQRVFTISGTRSTTLQNSGMAIAATYTTFKLQIPGATTPLMSCVEPTRKEALLSFQYCNDLVGKNYFPDEDLGFVVTANALAGQPLPAFATPPAANCPQGTLPLYHYTHAANANNDGINYQWESYYETFPPPISEDRNSVVTAPAFACLPDSTNGATLQPLYVMFSAFSQYVDQRIYVSNSNDAANLSQLYAVSYGPIYYSFAQQIQGTVSLASCVEPTRNHRVLSLQNCSDVASSGYKLEKNLGFVFPTK